ncbi:MAG TPA: kelch repeat-containing protein [Pseudonocardia sp.]
MSDPGFTVGGRPAIVIDLARAGFTDAVEVGRGGFGVVFRCTQEALNRTVAVKLLHTDLDTVSRERFFREGRAMGGLSGHPNVVDVLQVGVTHSGRPYIVMPFQSLDSLAVRVRREGPIPWDEASRMGVRLAGALESAHRVGTLHRDVKPANILLSDYGEAQLTDFGIARIEGGFETATGAFTGSLSYSAPEVLNGRPPTPASDIYGLAAALFSVIAGRAAFERREGEEIIAQFLRITGQPIPDLRGHGVPDEMCAVLETAMAKDPAARPVSAEAFGRQLQQVQRDANLPVAEMALPVARRQSDRDLTQTARADDDRSPRRTSNPLPLVERPWAGTYGAGAGAVPTSATPLGATPAGATPQDAHAQGPPSPVPHSPSGDHPRVGAAASTTNAASTNNSAQNTTNNADNNATNTALTAALAAAPPDGATVVVGAGGRPGSGPGSGRQAPPGSRSGHQGGQGYGDHLSGASAHTVIHDGHPGAAAVPAQRGEGPAGGGQFGPPGHPAPPASSTAGRPRRGFLLWAAAVTVVVLLASLVVVGVLVSRHPAASTAAAPPAVTPVVPASAWRDVRADPTARQQVATTVADGTVWVLGGITDGAATPLMEGYDPAIDTWKTGIALPVPLSHEMAVTYRGEIVVLGGWAAQGANLTAVSSNKVYAQRGGGWVELPPMLSPHVAAGAVVIGDEIVVSGGQADGKLVPTTEVFNGTSWRKVADLPTPREHLAMATDGTYAYAVGGRDLSADKNSPALERYDPKADTWTALAPMPAPRGGIGAAVSDGRLVVAGGEEPTSVDATVFAYDIVSNSWSDLPPMPAGRHGMAVAAVDKTVYAIGGATQPSHTGSTGAGQALQMPPRRLAAAPVWRELKAAPIARQFAGTTVAGGKMWIAGGLTQDAATAAVYGYDPVIDNWTQGPDLPIPLHHLAAVTYHNEVVVIGGWSPANGNLSGLVSGRVFALRNGAWAELPPLNHPRVAHAAAVVGDKIVVVGGQANSQLVPTTEVFDGTRWSDAAPIPTPREHLSATTDGTFVYAVGGRNLSSDKNSAAFERFDPAAGAWQTMPNMPTPRGGVAATCIDGRIVAAGGEEPTRVLNTVEAYDIDTGTWSGLAPLPVARHGMALATVGNSVFSVGGAQRPTHQQSAATVEALDFS